MKKMRLLNDIAFLQDTIWGITVLNWILCALFIGIGLLLKRYISVFFTRILYQLLKKYFSNYSAEQFKLLLTKPVSGLVANFLYFLALVRLLPKIDHVVIIPSLKRAVSPEGVAQGATAAVSLFDLLQHILYIAFIYYGFMLIIKIIEFILTVRYHKAFESGDRSAQQVIPLLKDIFKVVIWGLALVVGLGVVFHINVAALVAGLGIGGVAIAFAAKESLENLIASFMVLVDKPFTIGDWIKVENTEGIIEKVGFRSSRLRTFDKSIIVIPNRKLIDSNVENYSQRGTRRVRQVIGAIYGNSRENLQKAMEMIEAGVREVKGVGSEVNIHLDDFGSSQLNIVLVYFVDVTPSVNFPDVKQEINFIIYRAMYTYCHGFAFPTQTSLGSEELNEVNI